MKFCEAESLRDFYSERDRKSIFLVPKPLTSSKEKHMAGDLQFSVWAERKRTRQNLPKKFVQPHPYTHIYP